MHFCLNSLGTLHGPSANSCTPPHTCTCSEPTETRSLAHAQMRVHTWTYKRAVHNTGTPSYTPGTQSGVGVDPAQGVHTPGDLLLDRVRAPLTHTASPLASAFMMENYGLAQIVLRLNRSLKCLWKRRWAVIRRGHVFLFSQVDE